MDWNRIAQISSSWANAYELSLAADFVEHLDTLPDSETGTILFDVQSTGAAGAEHAAALTKELNEKAFLGLKTKIGIPDQPEGPAVGCRVKFAEGEATVQVICTDGSASKWAPFGKFSLPLSASTAKFEAAKFGEALAEGVLGRMVRAQYMRGPTVKGKATYQVRIDNASPLVLNGLAVLGTETKTEEQPKELSGICIRPAAKHDRSGHRRGGQDARPAQGHPRRRRRPERPLRADDRTEFAVCSRDPERSTRTGFFRAPGRAWRANCLAFSRANTGPVHCVYFVTSR